MPDSERSRGTRHAARRSRSQQQCRAISGSGGGGGGGGGGRGLLGLLPLLLGAASSAAATIACCSVVGAGLSVHAAAAACSASAAASQPGGQQASAAGQRRAACNTAERCSPCQRARLDRADLGQDLRGQRPDTISRRRSSSITGGGAVGLRRGAVGDGAVLLPDRPGRLSRHQLLRRTRSNRFGAKGDFAQAYVIAHEVGHHIQNLIGTSDQVQRDQQRGSRRPRATRCRSGSSCRPIAMPASGPRSNKDRLEPGDIEEGMTAANAIGDDTLQQQAQGSVRARQLHPRHLGPAHAVAAARPGHRRSGAVRHVRRVDRLG